MAASPVFSGLGSGIPLPGLIIELAEFDEQAIIAAHG
jgi:hypothetical protein